MSYLQTPQRPLPGAYIQTPMTTSRYQTGPPRPSFTRSGSNPSYQQPSNAPPGPLATQQSGQLQAQVPERPAPESLSPIARASKAINETLNLESVYPELDTYIGQGISSEYDVTNQAAWAPFQKVKMYPIPDRIFEQHNRAEFSTMMGLFADINHAWVTIDNACYLWDYTHPDPVLVGFEEQPHNITAVQLVYPRPGVFLPHITRLLVVATTSELMLVGVSTEAAPTGGLAVALYNIDMSVSVRGMDVNVIEGSKTGRIFFSGKCDNDIYEFTYQREEKWFQSRCGKVNHTGKGITLITPTFFTARKQQPEHTVQMAIDDSRNLLYTVSSASAIRVLHMKSSSELNLVISKSLDETLGNISHLTTPTDLISKSMRLVSICPVSAQEAARIHLVVVTSTGIRLFMSATPSYGNSSSSNAPTSMQIQHIKFPPPESSRPATTGQQPSNSTQLISGGSRGINTTSKALVNTRTASRYPPGYFFCFVSRDQQAQTDHLFVTAPDAGRIARPQETAALSRYMEYGLWLNLGSRAEDIGLSSPPFAASSSPTGFANELAVQYDKPTAEVAILTNTGVHTFRRRRLVDMFAAAIQGGGGGEGLEAEFKKFIRLYGRSETAATALAVTCGQGIDVTNESRASSINDPDILDRARKAFVEFGGKPVIDENALVGQSTPTIDMVHPSPRHDGLARYIARLVRSIWKALVAQESVTPAGGLTVSSPVSQAKLRDVQRGLTKLKEFLSANKSFIDGLAGPEALGRVSTKQEEISLQAEHRALHALTTLISNMIEGIAFVLTLFEERVEEVVLTLTNEARQQLRSLTYEGLFCSDSGRELAKELVKAIVDRNIASGSNVDTVAEALRRRCGSFCSANDVVIFKAQEQLRRASEAGSSSELARNLLNESLRLFKEVSESLSMEQLQWAVGQYLPMQFYAGAIELALSVARQSDRGNKALSWIQAGRPEQDPRATAFLNRKKCYDLIHQVIHALDTASAQVPPVTAKRKEEAYSVIESSDDEVFQTDLYDWYLTQGQADKLLGIQSRYVVTYLQRKSSEDIRHADLLWRYFSQWQRHHDAAKVQYILADSDFDLNLNQRIGYLSQAKANASIFTMGVPKHERYELQRQIQELVDCAMIQSDILEKLQDDERLNPDTRPAILKKIDGKILTLTELYNGYADEASYYDICLLIYQAADHRNPIDVRNTWRNHLESTHSDTLKKGFPLPYEAIASTVRTLGARLELSESTFPITELLPLLERYAFEFQQDVGPKTWVIDTFLDLKVPCETLFSVLEGMYYVDEAPFQGNNKRFIAEDMIYVARRWYEDTCRSGHVLGGDAVANEVLGSLETVMSNGIIGGEVLERAREVKLAIEGALRY